MEVLFSIFRIIRTAILSIAVSLYLCSRVASAEEVIDGCGTRLITLSPSLAEVVDVLGLTPKLAGVSQFTLYPEAAKSLPQIGGLLDPNVEGIIALQPSLVMGLSEHKDLIKKIAGFGVPTVIYDHRRTSGILDSIRLLGDRCSVQERASTVIKEINSRIEKVRSKTFGKAKKRALVLIGGKQDAVSLRNLYVSGRDGFYTDLLSLAGAENIFQGLTGAFSSVSREALIKEDPDYIVHIITDDQISSNDKKAILAAWGTLHYLSAVKNKKVLLLTDYVDIIPGPRFPEVLEKIYRFISGEKGV